MKSDRDSWVFRSPFVEQRTRLIFYGVGLLLALSGNGDALAQLQFTPDNVVPGSAGQASKSLPDGSASRSELVEEVFGDESAAAEDSPERAVGDDTADQQNEIVDQINSIRRQMGGGVADQLEGLLGEPGHGREQLQREFDR